MRRQDHLGDNAPVSDLANTSETTQVQSATDKHIRIYYDNSPTLNVQLET